MPSSEAFTVTTYGVPTTTLTVSPINTGVPSSNTELIIGPVLSSQGFGTGGGGVYPGSHPISSLLISSAARHKAS